MKKKLLSLGLALGLLVSMLPGEPLVYAVGERTGAAYGLTGDTHVTQWTDGRIRLTV